MQDSVSTFCALGRHALILAKRPAQWKKQQILDALEEATGTPMRAAKQLLTRRESGQKTTPDALALLDEYLKETGRIVSFVDGLQKQ
jgi:hypothetical protein